VDGFNPKSLMPADKIIEEALKGLKKDKYEIYPGPLKIVRYVIRWLPGLVLNFASKIGAKAMDARNN
jgi:uncharacterized oxidoreductase